MLSSSAGSTSGGKATVLLQLKDAARYRGQACSILSVTRVRGRLFRMMGWAMAGAETPGRAPCAAHRRGSSKGSPPWMTSSPGLDDRTLTLTNLDKVLYPSVGFTKAEVIDYYVRIAPVMLPHIRDRAMTRLRFPRRGRRGQVLLL